MGYETVRFHRDLWFPPDEFEDVTILPGSYRLNPSGHAKDRAKDNKYGVTIDIPDRIDVERDMVFEVGIDDRDVDVICFRTSNVDCFRNVESENWDLCMALTVDDRKVLSVWPNKADDHHETLDESGYGGPEDWPC